MKEEDFNPGACSGLTSKNSYYQEDTPQDVEGAKYWLYG
jgi:hypothetical protein